MCIHPGRCGSSLTVSGYLPIYPADYSGCVVNPNDPSQAIVLVDGSTGYQIYADDLRLARTDSTTFNLSPSFGGVFFFSQPQGAPCGMYDLYWLSPQGNQYIAVFDNFFVGLVLLSSGGSTKLAPGQYLTA